MTKAGIDWADIQARFVAGESANSIALTAGVTKQAILKRKDREGWARSQTPADKRQAQRKPAVSAAPAQRTPPRALEVVQAAPATVPRAGNLPEPPVATADDALQAIRRGAPRALLCRRYGMSPADLAAWMESDPRLVRWMEYGETETALRLIDEAHAASKRGDSKMTQFLLSNHPMTKEEFAAASRKEGGGVINVILNIPRPEPVQMIDVEAMVIEHV